MKPIEIPDQNSYHEPDWKCGVCGKIYAFEDSAEDCCKEHCDECEQEIDAAEIGKHEIEAIGYSFCSDDCKIEFLKSL